MTRHYFLPSNLFFFQTSFRPFPSLMGRREASPPRCDGSCIPDLCAAGYTYIGLTPAPTGSLTAAVHPSKACHGKVLCYTAGSIFPACAGLLPECKHKIFCLTARAKSNSIVRSASPPCERQLHCAKSNSMRIFIISWVESRRAGWEGAQHG